MEFRQIIALLESVQEMSDGGYLARCPAHDDSHPSLRVWYGENGVVRLHCRAGCSFSDVVAAMGLRPAAMFDVTGEGVRAPAARPSPVGARSIAALRVWLDSLSLTPAAVEYAQRRFGLGEDELRALGVVAFDPGRHTGFFATGRAFTQFPRLVVPMPSFDGVVRGVQGRDISGQCTHRWVSLRNPEGEQWALYGVLRPAGESAGVIVCEGPGDALTAVSAGFTAVAIRGAYLTARDDLMRDIAAGVAGDPVLVLGDADEAGRRFAARAVAALTKHGVSARAIAPPTEGWDLTAWREAGPDSFADDLRDAIQRGVSVAQMGELSAEQVSAVVDAYESAVSEYGATDAGRAYALAACADGRIRYTDSMGFFVWTGTVWEQNSTLVREAAHFMGRALVAAGKVREAVPFGTTRHISHMLEELASVPGIRCNHDDFDANPHLLAFRNGTVDLRTGEMRPHDKRDMLTYALDVDYRPNAECPRWERFLEEIFPGHPEMPAYMQRLIGYGITGLTDEQCFAVLWGKGANGKTVLTDTLTHVFGQVTTTTPFSTFEAKSGGGGIPNDIAALRGARLVMASEGESGRSMSEATLKRVTGKDKISARFLRREFFDFRPAFLLLLSTNHKPRFRGQDEGLWRRVKMVPFLRYFAPHERDPKLDVKLRSEAEGIAAWAVRGAVEWYRRGLEDPDLIVQATQEYRETSDALAGFFPGILVRDETARISGSDAFQSYLDWCEAENLPGRERWTRQAFYQAMEERGVVKRRGSKGMVLVGVRMAESLPDPGPGIFAD